jgi:hypothetical protein
MCAARAFCKFKDDKYEMYVALEEIYYVNKLANLLSTQNVKDGTIIVNICIVDSNAQRLLQQTKNK